VGAVFIPFITLGRAYLAQGKRLEALTHFQRAAPSAKSDAHCLIEVLSGLEEASEDPTVFRAFCRGLQEEHREVGDGSLVQWYLEPTQPDFGFSILDFGLPTSEDQIPNPKSNIQNGDW
jgi:hypothetical protein